MPCSNQLSYAAIVAGQQTCPSTIIMPAPGLHRLEVMGVRGRRDGNRMAMKSCVWIPLLASSLLIHVSCERDKKPAAASALASRPVTPEGQSVCPVSNYDIDPNVFVDYRGIRVYLCCEGCKETFQKYPGRFVSKLPQFGGKEETSLGKMPK